MVKIQAAEFVLSFILLALILARVGYKVAKQYGRPPVWGALLAGAFPLVGLGVLVYLGRKANPKAAVMS